MEEAAKKNASDVAEAKHSAKLYWFDLVTTLVKISIKLHMGQTMSALNGLRRDCRRNGRQIKLKRLLLLLLLLLLLPPPDGISIRKMLGTDVVYISLSNYSCIYLLSK